MYPDDFHVDIDYEPRITDMNYWNQYQIVHIHRNIGQSYEQTPIDIGGITSYIKTYGIAFRRHDTAKR